jgi:hypothetical protein
MQIRPLDLQRIEKRLGRMTSRGRVTRAQALEILAEDYDELALVRASWGDRLGSKRARLLASHLRVLSDKSVIQ